VPRPVDLSSLNPEQRAAVLHRGAPLLLLAGAGSGKTRVVTFRIAQLLSEGVLPDEVLGVTFTNKAAEEMRQRIRAMLPDDPEAARAITLSTFHSLGVRILREAGSRSGVRQPFTILDSEDQRQVVRSILNDKGIDPDLLPPPVVANRISRAKNDGLGPADLLARARSHGERTLAQVAAAYDAALRSLGALDFDDLLLLPVRLLTEHEDVRDGLRARWRHVLVDEYQDSNRIQLRLVQLLVGAGENLVVVGDDDQSIYGWRGACVDNILAFEQHFPSACVLNLTRNYRSTTAVLDIANDVMRAAARRRPKDLWTNTTDGPPVRLVVCRTPADEAAYVAMAIDSLHRDEGLRYEDVGVLYRTNGQSRELEEAFRAAGVPHRVVGGLSFFERREVKDALAYVRLLVNERDEIALRRALDTTVRGVGSGTVTRLQAWAQLHIEPLFEALRKAGNVQGVSPRIARAAQHFAQTVDTYRARLEGGDLAEVVDRLLDDVGLRAAIRAGEGGRSPAAARFHLANIDLVVQSIRDYQARLPEPTLADYLMRITLDSSSDKDEPETGRVTLMTLHSAKGLEFPAVFLVGVEEGFLPHLRSMEENRTPDGVGEDDEERRLFYVGITRARRWLTMSRCLSRSRFDGELRPEPSRFLKDIPPARIEVTDRTDGSTPTTAPEPAKNFRRLLDMLG
jgi:DNA helicase-2/ATP-dependent DNA helicase PcrA